jgi:hypothetical protein
MGRYRTAEVEAYIEKKSGAANAPLSYYAAGDELLLCDLLSAFSTAISNFSFALYR